MNIFVDVSNIKIFQMELLENFMIENNIEYEKIYTIYSIDDRDKEIERLQNTIKEVREYIYNKEINTLHFNSKNLLDTSIATELLEILDKVDKGE